MYQICNRCVMDNASDPYITFDSNGCCNYCTEALARMPKTYFPNSEGESKLNKLLGEIKERSKGEKYDCLMGISGGLDSSYLAYLGAAKWGLRILAVHVDDGFDTDISKSNLDKLCKKAGFDLINIKPDETQYNDLTAAYIRANVPNIAIPQDNILFACLYQFARQYKIKYFLSGGNFALESILQRGNTYGAFDLINLKAIHKRYGKENIDKLPLLSHYRRSFDKRILGIKTVLPLDFIDYNRDRALKELNDFCGFTYYGSKHLENLLTKFIQQYWFYNHYKVDKRHSHLSSMIISGQLTRDRALEELQKPLYDEKQMDLDRKYVLEKLGIPESEFEKIMCEMPKQHTDYPTDPYLTSQLILGVKKIIKRILIKK